MRRPFGLTAGRALYFACRIPGLVADTATWEFECGNMGSLEGGVLYHTVADTGISYRDGIAELSRKIISMRLCYITEMIFSSVHLLITSL